MSESNFLTLLQQMQAEISTLKETVGRQEAEITRLRAEQTVVVAPQVGQQATSRRRALKRLMLGVAGAAAATTTLSSTSQIAQAGGCSASNIGWYAYPDSASHSGLSGLPFLRVGLAGST